MGFSRATLAARFSRFGFFFFIGFCNWGSRLDPVTSFKIIDLTHDSSPETPTWNGGSGFEHEIKHDYDECKSAVKFRVQQIKMHAGVGTHLDAPAHAIPNGKTIDKLDLNDLIAPCVVIDVANKAHERYFVSLTDIEEFEQQNGRLEPGFFVIILNGWDRFWQDSEKYRNNLVFPSVSLEAVQLLLEKNIVGLGIDTLSPDRPDNGFLVHQAILGAGKYIVENIANSHLLPKIGCFTLALPIKTVDGTEAPIRMVASLK